jgi:FMN phosphatase YigB (HAD superfamily)
LANSSFDGALHEGKQKRLHEYLARSHVTPNQSVIIGDTVEEVHIGRSLGMHTVCITGGAMSTRRLTDAKPDAIIHKLQDLYALLKKL